MSEFTSPLTSEQLSAAELSRQKKMIENIVPVITRGKDVPIVWNNGRGWFWSFKDGPNGKITADENDLVKEGFDYAVGVMTHEHLHPMLDDVTQFTDEEWHTPGFAVGYNWFADNRIEYAADDFINAGKEKIRGHLAVDVQPGKGIDFTVGTKKDGLNGSIEQKVGYIPKHMLFGAVARHYFYEKEIAGTLKTENDMETFVKKVRKVNSEVADTFVRTVPHIERFYKTLPPQYASEAERNSKSREAGAVFKGYIWPEYKKLVDESYEDHQLSKFIEDLLDGAEFDGQSQGGQIIVVDISQLPTEVQQEIKDKVKEAAKRQQGQEGEQNKQDQQQGQPSGQSGQEGQPGKQGQKPGQEGQQNGGQEGEQNKPDQQQGQPSGQSGQEGQPDKQGQKPGQEGQQNGGQEGGQGEQQSEQQRVGQAGQVGQQGSQDGKQTGLEGQGQTGQEDGSFGEKDGKQQSKIPWNELSDKAKKSVKEAWDKVSQEAKEKVQHEANKEMGEMEDAVNEDLQAHTDKDGASRPSEVKKHIEEKKSGDEKGESQDISDTKGEQSGMDKSQQQQSDSSSSSQTSGGSSELLTPSETDIEDLQKYKEKMKGEYKPKGQYDLRKEAPWIKKSIDYLNAEMSFDPNQNPKVRFSATGDEFDVEKAIQDDLSNKIPIEPFIENGEKEAFQYQFYVLVDMSSSMSDKLGEVMDFLVVNTEYLSFQGIPNAVLGYTDYWADGVNGIVRYFKRIEDTEGFGAVVPESVKQQLGMITDFQGLPIGRGGTPTSSSMLATFEYVIKPHHEQNPNPNTTHYFFLVLTDGQPTDSDIGKTSQETAIQTQRVLYDQAAAMNMPHLSILGLGIGKGTEFVKDIFPPFPDNLKAELAHILSKVRNTSVRPQDVTPSFMDPQELVFCYPAILKFVIEHPDEFTRR